MSIIPILALFIVSNLTCQAQTTETEKDKVLFRCDFVDAGYGNYYLRFPMMTTSKSITSARMCLSKAHFKKLVKLLEKNAPTLKKWEKTATDEGVKSYEKRFDIEGIPIDRIYYSYENNVWYNNSQVNGFGVYLDRLYASFFVGSDGVSAVMLKSEQGKKRISDEGTTTESTTTANTGAFGSKQVVGQSVTKTYKIVDCGDFMSVILIKDLDEFINQLKKVMNGFDKKESVDNLFK